MIKDVVISTPMLPKSAPSLGLRMVEFYIDECYNSLPRNLTDDFISYRGLEKVFANHHVINHGKKKRIRDDVHTNTIEGYFSIFKRGIIGVYHHVGKQHLHRYLSEFNFRYNRRKIDDSERSVGALSVVEGKKLTYRDSSASARN